MDDSEIQQWLRETDPDRLDALYHLADQVRRQAVGDEVHLRALVEVSNYCRRSCTYCGIRASRGNLLRYRMTAEEVVDALRVAVRHGCGTAVLQAGEDPGLGVGWVTETIGRIKQELGLAVTLSLGERTNSELDDYRRAGADRYLLRFETSNESLFQQVHPPHASDKRPRRAILGELRNLGYEVGSGVMVGLPGTGFDDLARDIQLFRNLDLDMVGVGPYIPDPETPLGRDTTAAAPDQVPNTATMTCKVIALARLVCPTANIPSTTALATISATGRELGLRCGANVWMPNFTPTRFRGLYRIYPGKSSGQHVEVRHDDLQETLGRLGRRPATGAGPSQHYVTRG